MRDIIFALRRWLGRIHIGRWEDPRAWGAATENIARKWLRKMPVVPMTDQRFTLPERLRGEYRGGDVQGWQHAALARACGIQEEAFSPEELVGRAGEGTLPYGANIPGLRLVDTLWMACPGLFRSGERQAHMLAKRQLEEYLSRGLHPDTGLPAHAFGLESGAPLGVYGWGRGTAFLFLALVESLPHADAETRSWLLARALTLAGILQKAQLPDGGWGWLLFGGGPAESSATAMLGTGFALLAREAGWSDYARVARDARSCLMGLTRRDGTVDYAQGDTRGIGMYSARREPLPLAQAYAVALARLTADF